MTGKTGPVVTALRMMLIIVLIPPLVFLVVGISSGMSVAELISAMLEQYTQRKQNLLVVGLMGWFPLALLGITLWVHRKFGGSEQLRPVLRMAGFVPLLLIMVWVNFEFWPDFLPGRVYPGFPSGLEFLIGPAIFAPAAMAICILVAWLAARKSVK